jgi:hypothetical protein
MADAAFAEPNYSADLGYTARVDIPYLPRDVFQPLHSRRQRWAAIVAHRRAGKTVACINELIRAALTNTRQHPPPRYAYLAPTYSQAKDVAWAYLKHFTAPLPSCEMRESDLQVILFNGAIIRLYGADNYDRLRGIYLDGIVIDEPADIDPRAWPEVIRPALADHNGWGVFIGTPKGRNHFYDLVTAGEKSPADWLVLRLPVSATGLIDQAELADARRTMSREQYQQEFECSFDAAVIGSYYGKQMAEAEAAKPSRITGVPYDPSIRVWTAWDLGIRDAMAIWFAQLVGREIHLIDYYEQTGADLGHYVRELDKRTYAYDHDILPHDAQAKELGTGKSRKEFLEGLGRKTQLAPNLRIEDGIEAVRMILPRCWFDKTRCARGIDALKMYRAEYDARLQNIRPTPVHDWASHGSDAFRMLAITIDRQLDTGSFSRTLKYPKMAGW